MEIPKRLTEVSNSTSVRTRNEPTNSGESGSGSRSSEKKAPEREDALPTWEREQTTKPQASGPSDVSYTLRNAFDGIALLEIANEALERIYDNLQQAREIASTALQTGKEGNDYSRLQRQLQQRLDAMEGIAVTTSYKGVRIFQGGLGCAYFQVDLNSGRIVAINLDTSLRRSALGGISTATSGNLRQLFGGSDGNNSYTTPPIRDLNFFTAPRHAIFSVDGIPTGLFRDWQGNPSAASTALQERLNALLGSERYEVSYANQRFTIHSTSGVAPVLSAASMRGTEFIGGSSNDAEQSGKFVLEPGDFTLMVGDNSAIEITGSFSHLNELVQAINEQADNLIALADQQNTRLSLSAYETISITGEKACSPQWLGFNSHVRQPTGNLSRVSLLEDAGRMESLQRIDAAITQITAMRVRFEEIKKRFLEAMNEMQKKVREKKTDRPKIVDPNELIASLKRTREQLPQQVSTSIQAQANVNPHAVNSLLSQDYQEKPLCFCQLHCKKGKERCI